MTTAYTSRPWSKSKTGDGPKERNLITTVDHVIAEICHAGIEWEEFEANTDLIMASPDLFEALIRALVAMQIPNIYGGGYRQCHAVNCKTNALDFPKDEDCDCWIRDAKAAIAKTGQSELMNLQREFYKSKKGTT